MEKRIFNIRGMHCAACAAAIERTLKKLPETESAVVNLATSELFYSGNASDEEVIKAVAKAGFSGERTVPSEEMPSGEPLEEKQEARKDLADLAAAWIFGIGTAVTAHLSFLSSARWNGVLQFLLLLCVMAAGRKFFTGGIPALLRGRPDMNSLVATGVLAGVSYSLFTLVTAPGGHLFFDAGAMILMLVMLGKFLEARSKRKAADALRHLFALAPQKALEILPDGSEREIPVSQVCKGMKLKVLPGEKIPADGRVLSGNSSCDESMFTGEALPAVKHPDSPVTGGAVNRESVLIIEAVNCGRDSMLSGIIEAVRAAQGSKAPVARLADIAARYFVWGVITIAVLTFVIHLLCGSSGTSALSHALSVLVVACPCSLGLATPIALICGIGKGAGSGIVIKNGAVMEEMSKIRAAVFDKTGTLTTGNFSIVSIEVCKEKWNEDRLLLIAAALEKNTNHPLAEAILKEAKARLLELPDITDAVTVPGYGVTGSYGGVRYEICRSSGEDTAAAAGKSAVLLKGDGQVIGKILLRDTLRPEACAAVETLHKMGIKVEMLTGDNSGAAEAAAEELRLEGFTAGVYPAEKRTVLKELRKKYGKIAMVGDGINDAPALAEADLGIAIGSGSAAAIGAADAVLISEDLRKVPEALQLSRRTMRIIRQNLFWAFAYNLLGIPLAAGAFDALLPFTHVSPVFCAAAMGLSSVTVVLNALRLKR